MRSTAFFLSVVALTGCGASDSARSQVMLPTLRPSLEVVAESARRWTGIAIRTDGKIVVNYPRWSDDVPMSVATLDPQGAPIPYPNPEWNSWSPGQEPNSRWVSVQSVTVDREGRLWVLDTGNPRFEGVIEGAPKLVCFEDPEDTDETPRVYTFTSPVITQSSYLNDVRIDIANQHVYLTDSGDGALIVVDLETGAMRRVLDGHPSVEAEDITLQIGGQPFNRVVHADGIAL